MSNSKNGWLKHAMVGPHFVACMLIGWFIGNYWLDRWLDSFPIWTVVFLILGLAAGFVNLFRVLANINEEERNEDSDEPKT